MFEVAGTIDVRGRKLEPEAVQQLWNVAETVVLEQGLAMVALCSCQEYRGYFSNTEIARWGLEIFINSHLTAHPHHSLIPLFIYQIRQA